MSQKDAEIIEELGYTRYTVLPGESVGNNLSGARGPKRSGKAKKTLTAKVDQQVLADIEEIAESAKSSKSKVSNDLLIRGLGYNPEATCPSCKSQKMRDGRLTLSDQSIPNITIKRCLCGFWGTEKSLADIIDAMVSRRMIRI